MLNASLEHRFNTCSMGNHKVHLGTLAGRQTVQRKEVNRFQVTLT